MLDVESFCSTRDIDGGDWFLSIVPYLLSLLISHDLSTMVELLCVDILDPVAYLFGQRSILLIDQRLLFLILRLVLESMEGWKLCLPCEIEVLERLCSA